MVQVLIDHTFESVVHVNLLFLRYDLLFRYCVYICI